MLSRIYFFLFLFTLSLFVHTTKGQNASILFEKISNKEGLPANQVNFMTQDAQGYLWIAFKQQIARYDGYHFVKFPNPEVITGLQADKKGKVWFSTIRGIFSIDEKKLTTQHHLKSNLFDANSDNDHFENLYIDQRGFIWMNDFANIKYFNPQSGKIRSFSLKNPQAFNRFGCHYQEDNSGMLWIANNAGLQRFNPKTNQLEQWILNQRFTSCCLKNTNELLLLDETGIISSFDLSKKKSSTITYFPADNSTPSMLHTCPEKDLFWVGSERSMYLFSSKTKQFQALDNLAEEGYAYNLLYEDQKHQIFWIATSSGLLKYNHKNSQLLQHISLPKKLVSFPVTVTCFEEENPDNYWLGLSHSGVLHWQRSTQQFKAYPIPSDERIIQLLRIPTGSVLACTPSQIFELKIGSKQWSIYRKSLYSLLHIHLDKQNRLWCLAENGPIEVFDFLTKKVLIPWKKLPYPTFFSQNIFQYSQEGADGKIWLAAWFPKGFGICYFDSQKKEFILAENQNIHTDFVSDYFLSICPLPPNNIAFSGFGGVNCLNTKTGKLTHSLSSTKLELLGGECKHIRADKQGNMWLGTSNGLCWIDKQNHASSFTEADGLSDNNNTNGFLINAKNELFTGYVNKFNLLNINQLHKKNKIKTLVLSGLSILGDSSKVDLEKPLIFEATQNNLSFQVSPLNYQPASQNHIRFRLKGVQNAWIDNGILESITFSNLPPNSYVLEVSLGDGIGNWSKTSLEIPFEITPHFYQTSLFKLLIFITIGLLFYAFYQYRIRQIKAIYAVRNRISADLHDEVGTTISGISIVSNILKQRLEDNSENSNFVERITEDARKISEAIDDIVWSIKPQNDSLTNILARMTRYACELLETKNIAYRMNMPSEHAEKNIPMEKRHDLYLIFKELVNNIAKHSECSEARISVETSSKLLKMTIEDNGKGFNTNQKTHRNGLGNIRERVQKLNGNCEIESFIGKGTKISIQIPI